MKNHTPDMHVPDNFDGQPAETTELPGMADAGIAVPELIPHSDNILTVPNGMTAFRAVMGAVIPTRMIQGKGHATISAVAAGVSDFESQVARRIEPHYPGRGYSKIGKRADPIVDAEYAAGVAIGTLASPRASRGAKLGAAITMTKVGRQAAWAAKADAEHRKLTGEPYVADVGIIGKLGTVAMLAGGAAGTLTHDLNPLKPRQNKLRRKADIAAPVLASVGLVLGETAKAIHNRKLEKKLAPLRAAKKTS